MIVVQVLGGAIITSGEHRIRASAARIFAMALYLAGERGRYLNRAVALTTLFGDQADANAAHSFRQFVYRLRTAGFPIESRETDLRLPADAVRTDVDDVLQAKRLTAEQLTAIQRGVLPGVSYPTLPLLNEWLDSYRTRIERELQQALVKQLGAAREVGDWANAERAARACLTFDPLNEEATLGLAEALAIGGSKAAAVKLLEEYSNEVGVSSGDLKIAANVLRRRISERLPETGYRAKAELPFVGRDEEMFFLRERLTRARAGESQCVLIHGEPGIGKSRLTTEFVNIAILDGARTAQVSAQPHDLHRPLAAFAELVPLLLQMPGALGCSPQSMQALRQLTGHAIGSDEHDFAELAPEARFDRTTSAIRDLIDAVAGECLLLIVLEDAQWIDPLSLQFVGGLVAQRGERRQLTILTSRERTSVMAHVRHDGRTQVLHLDPLRADVGLKLAELALARVALSSEANLSKRVQETAGGNPLFIASLAEHWRDATARFSMPDSVSSIIQYQLEGVTTTALTVLHAVILLGRRCTLSRIAESLQLNALQLADSLQELENRALLARGPSAIACRHWLISDAALCSAPAAKITWLHGCVAACLERESRRLGERTMLWDAAEHWIRANEGERAYATLLECANAAASIGRSREACDILARASELTTIQEHKVQALEQALEHAARGSETIRAFDLFSRLRSIGVTIRPELQLLELAAKMHAGKDLGAIGQVEAMLLNAPSDAVAMDGALRLVKLADQLNDRSLADRARAVRSRVAAVPRALWLEFELVYETGFGCIETALTAARELRDICQSWEVAARVGKQYNIGQVYLLSGRVDDAIQLHVDTYESGTRMGLLRMPIASAFILASLYRDLDRSNDYDLWASRAHGLVAEDPSLRGAELLMFEAEDAFWHRDVDATIVRSNNLRHLAEDSGNERVATYARALSIAARHIESRLAGAELDALKIDVRQLRGLRGDDLLTHVATEELMIAHRDAEASLLLSAYLSQVRQIRSPLWIGLQWLVKRLGISADIIEASHVPC